MGVSIAEAFAKSFSARQLLDKSCRAVLCGKKVPEETEQE